MEDKYIFISYSSKQYEIALNIKNMIEKQGVSTWMAPQSIFPGGDYASDIPDAIEGCMIFLLLLSTESQKSKWVPKELDLAIDFEKVIIPFHIDNEDIIKEFYFRLTNVQRIEAYENIALSCQNLLQKINDFLNSEKGVESWRAILENRSTYISELQSYDFKNRVLRKSIIDKIDKAMDARHIAVLTGTLGVGKTFSALLYSISESGQNHKFDSNTIFINIETIDLALDSLLIRNERYVSLDVKSKYLLFEETLNTRVQERDGNNVLIIYDNLGNDITGHYSDGKDSEEKSFAAIIQRVHELGNVYSIVTTRMFAEDKKYEFTGLWKRKDIEQNKIEIIDVGNVGLRDVEHFLLFGLELEKEEYGEEKKAVEKLFETYGSQNNDLEYELPILTVTTLRDIALTKNIPSYKDIAIDDHYESNSLVKTVNVLLEKLIESDEEGRVFVRILEVISCLYRSELTENLLLKCLEEYIDCSSYSVEYINKILQRYSDKLNILKFHDNKKYYSIHHGYQEIIFRQLGNNEYKVVKSVTEALYSLSGQSIYSPLGAGTWRCYGGIAKHIDTIYSKIKKYTKIDLPNEYYELLTGYAWYAGYVNRDLKKATEIYDYILSNCESIFIIMLSIIERAILILELEARIDGIEQSDLDCDMASIIEGSELSQYEKDHLEVRYAYEKVCYNVLAGQVGGQNEENAIEIINNGISIAEKVAAGFSRVALNQTKNRSRYIYMLEHQLLLHFKKATILRKVFSDFNKSFEECNLAIELINNNKTIGVSRYNIEYEMNILYAKLINEAAVAMYEERDAGIHPEMIIENCKKINELYEKALDIYMEVAYLPGVNNEYINQVTLNRKMAEAYLEMSKQSDEVENETYLNEYKKCIETAEKHLFRIESSRTYKNAVHMKDFYTYYYQLCLTKAKKADLFLQTEDELLNEAGLWLEKASQYIFDFRNKSINARYQGVLFRKRLELSDVQSSKIEYFEKGKEALQVALDEGKSANNATCIFHAQMELCILYCVYGDHERARELLLDVKENQMTMFLSDLKKNKLFIDRFNVVSQRIFKDDLMKYENIKIPY